MIDKIDYIACEVTAVGVNDPAIASEVDEVVQKLSGANQKVRVMFYEKRVKKTWFTGNADAAAWEVPIHSHIDAYIHSLVGTLFLSTFDTHLLSLSKFINRSGR